MERNCSVAMAREDAEQDGLERRMAVVWRAAHWAGSERQAVLLNCQT